MSTEDFFGQPEVLRVLERAGRSAGTPLSVHLVARNQEGPRLAGWDACEACRYVSEVPRGRWACQASRRSAAALVLAQRRPLGFVCHLGFACLSTPAISGEHFVLTFGPYVPVSADQSLEFDVRNGLLALDVELDPDEALPVSLDDIRRLPLETLPAIAEWAVEALVPLWADWQAAQDSAESQEPARLPDAIEIPSVPSAATAPYQDRFSRHIAAALAGGNQPQARALLQGHLQEMGAEKRASVTVRRARMLRLVSEALEAVEHAGIGSPAAWDAFPAFVAAVRIARKDADLLDAAMLVLGIVKRKVSDAAPESAAGYVKLNALLTDRLGEKVTLEEAAAQLGVSPSALSHDLRRKFGMNFSAYAGSLRIEKAKELLRSTRLSATEIARRVGVADQSHFSKLFRKFAGMAPSTYRERFGRKA